MGFKIKNKVKEEIKTIPSLKKGFLVKVVKIGKKDYNERSLGNNIFKSYPFDILSTVLKIPKREVEGICLSPIMIKKIHSHILKNIYQLRRDRQHWMQFMPALSLLDFILNMREADKLYTLESESVRQSL